MNYFFWGLLALFLVGLYLGFKALSKRRPDGSPTLDQTNDKLTRLQGFNALIDEIDVIDLKMIDVNRDIRILAREFEEEPEAVNRAGIIRKMQKLNEQLSDLLKSRIELTDKLK